MPSRAAVSVMRWAKAGEEPEINSPNAVATSLAECATRDCTPCSTVTVWPAPRPSLVCGIERAYSENGTGVVRVRRPAFSSSKTI